MADLKWIQGPDEHESLAIALRALLATRDSEAAYDELLGTLALGTATVALAGQPVIEWPAHARDVALPATAELFGLRLRELHPTAATIGLESSAEFEMHFRDSYAPLMVRALEARQVCLAWRGWPTPAEREWGVITKADHGGLFGKTVGHADRLIELGGPAWQVYVVEDINTMAIGALTADRLFNHALQVATRSWNGAYAAMFDALFGYQAYDAWAEVAESAEPEADTRVLASCAHSARRHMGAWLRRIEPKLTTASRPTAQRWAATCEDVAGYLADLPTRGGPRQDAPVDMPAIIRQARDREAAFFADLPHTNAS